MNNINTEYRVYGEITIAETVVGINFDTKNNAKPQSIYFNGAYKDTSFRGSVTENSFEIFQNGSSAIPDSFINLVISESRKIMSNYLNY